MIPCMLCGAHVLIMLTSHFVVSQFMCVHCACLQCGRSKRKSFWNDEEETVPQEYPIGTEAHSFSHTQGKQQVSHQMSTLLMPHLLTCEQSVRELPRSLSRPHPFQTPLYTCKVSPSCAIPQLPIRLSHVPVSVPTQQPKIFWQQLLLCLVLTLSLCNYFISAVISTCCGYVFDSFTLVLDAILFEVSVKNTYLAWAFSCRFVLYSVEKGKCVGSLDSSCYAVYITAT